MDRFRLVRADRIDIQAAVAPRTALPQEILVALQEPPPRGVL
jgi:hypothetical protein